jgi:hypothetical protein
VVDSGVGNDDYSGFLEGFGDVIGEVTGGESTGNSLSTGETSHLEDSSVTVRSGRDDGNVIGVLDGGENSGSEDELLPSLADVEDVDTCELVWSFGSVSAPAASCCIPNLSNSPTAHVQHISKAVCGAFPVPNPSGSSRT